MSLYLFYILNNSKPVCVPPALPVDFIFLKYLSNLFSKVLRFFNVTQNMTNPLFCYKIHLNLNKKFALAESQGQLLYSVGPFLSRRIMFMRHYCVAPVHCKQQCVPNCLRSRSTYFLNWKTFIKFWRICQVLTLSVDKFDSLGSTLGPRTRTGEPLGYSE